ncbi:folate-binding protein [Novosphingobium sp. Chol11]|uniref:CAF17-like 4Fe-4S cluster assembly/insertion protein YgfZ n=1 Tax=Novosphingobium sp. Chol11 TaxID=1385763 RepID=UPI0025CD455E|nr:folate-binding protein [Novosphingobium sp. Chol11]
MTAPRLFATRLFTRALIRVAPLDPQEDVAGFLQGLVTNDMTGPLPVWAALLSPQGKALFDFLVWPEAEGDALLLDCEAAQADALVKRLSMYRLRRKIAISRIPDLGVFWSAAADAAGTPDPRLAALGRRWLAPVGADDAPADTEWQERRLAHGVSEGLAELGSDQTLWLECNAAELHGVSFTKGCYVGQENTARMNWRQKVNRRLMVVPLHQSDPARQRAAYPALGLAVDHLRVEAINPASRPAWLPVIEAEPE